MSGVVQAFSSIENAVGGQEDVASYAFSDAYRAQLAALLGQTVHMSVLEQTTEGPVQNIKMIEAGATDGGTTLAGTRSTPQERGRSS